MSRFLTDITSIYWWISVVIVGILIHVLSTLLAKVLDKRMSKASTWWRGKSEKRKLQRQEAVAKLRASEHEQVMMALDVIRHRLIALMHAILGFLFIAVSGLQLRFSSVNGSRADKAIGVLQALIGAIFMLIAVRRIMRATRASILLGVARNEDAPDNNMKEANNGADTD